MVIFQPKIRDCIPLNHAFQRCSVDYSLVTDSSFCLAWFPAWFIRAWQNFWKAWAWLNIIEEKLDKAWDWGSKAWGLTKKSSLRGLRCVKIAEIQAFCPKITRKISEISLSGKFRTKYCYENIVLKMVQICLKLTSKNQNFLKIVSIFYLNGQAWYRLEAWEKKLELGNFEKAKRLTRLELETQKLEIVWAWQKSAWIRH